MDILNAIEKLREYKDDKEEKQSKEQKLYEEQCRAYENIIQSMSNEMDQVLELKKIATKCLDSAKLYEFHHSGKSITFGKDNDSFICSVGNTQMDVVKVDKKYIMKFPSIQNRLLFMKKFVEDFETFKKNLIKSMDEVTS